MGLLVIASYSISSFGMLSWPHIFGGKSLAGIVLKH